MRGVDWTDVEIKTNILKLTGQHGYFIKLPCDVLDAGSHSIYFILGYSCSFKKRRSTLTHFIAGIGILPFGWGGGSGSVKLTSHHQKETWLYCVTLYCDATNIITVSHCNCDIQTTSQCVS